MLAPNRLRYNVLWTNVPAARRENPPNRRKPDPSRMQRQTLNTLREKDHQTKNNFLHAEKNSQKNRQEKGS